LLAIYDKSDMENIEDNEIKERLASLLNADSPSLG
jgi:hypothetical protein